MLSLFVANVLGLGAATWGNLPERMFILWARTAIADSRSEEENSIMLRQVVTTLEPWCIYWNWAWSPALPRDREAEFEEVWFTTSDRLRLHGRFYSAADAGIEPVITPRPVVLFFHGTGGDVHRWRPIAPRWQDILGADVLVFDYRGYGRSAGSPSEAGLKLDARAAYNWLIEERGYAADQVVMVGQSLGGAIAIDLASEFAPRALVLESTFTRVTDVADRLGLGIKLGRRMSSSYASIELLQGFDRPVFISHGEDDLLIPHRHAARLFETATGPKQLMLVPRMGHYDRRGQEYKDAVREFFLGLE
jgi:fermentation-respiration switch protein FrsA (DUF1100 family)